MKRKEANRKRRKSRKVRKESHLEEGSREIKIKTSGRRVTWVGRKGVNNGG